MSIDEIRSYIQIEILNDPTLDIEPDQDLLLTETLDSLSVMRLVGHLEEAEGLAIPPEDVTLENFQTLQRIEAYLVLRRGA